ncbi:MAG: SDR family NAD(P)-dependent oxidoreductase [Pseudonocardia sp.]|nr:SDR family NAD(P)-dependent oxidoreductase [Pseudonocardia sp.]
MPNKTIVITGASDGIGAAAARALVGLGHDVVVVGRSPAKTRGVADQLGATSFVADFADLRQVRDLAAELVAGFPRIDVLANNVGALMSGDRETTVDGHEKTFQVNYLAPFLLTSLLTETLVRSGGTVINTASMLGKILGRVDLDDLDAREGFSAMGAYGSASLEILLASQELHRRSAALGVSVAAFHPGVVATNVAAGSTRLLRMLYSRPVRRFLTTPEKGADTLVWLATSQPGTDWASGGYYSKRKPMSFGKRAADTELAARLWGRSEELVSTAEHS